MGAITYKWVNKFSTKKIHFTVTIKAGFALNCSQSLVSLKVLRLKN